MNLCVRERYPPIPANLNIRSIKALRYAFQNHILPENLKGA